MYLALNNLEWFVAEAISLWNNDDDNSINKGRYTVKQKMPSERQASLNN